jgi:hypothetical protein
MRIPEGALSKGPAPIPPGTPTPEPPTVSRISLSTVKLPKNRTVSVEALLPGAGDSVEVEGSIVDDKGDVRTQRKDGPPTQAKR